VLAIIAYAVLKKQNRRFAEREADQRLAKSERKT
jgi:hypothetical protein